MKNNDQSILEQLYSEVLKENMEKIKGTPTRKSDLKISQELYSNPEYIKLHELLGRLYKQFSNTPSEQDRVKIDNSIKVVWGRMKQMEEAISFL